MSELWKNLSFMVLATDAPLADVLDALAIDFTIVDAAAPRRLSLGYAIHEDAETSPCRFAVWQQPGAVVIALPASGFPRTGDAAWARALSGKYGRAWIFQTSPWSCQVVFFEHGDQVRAVTSSGVEAEGEILGVSALSDDEDAAVETVLAMMAGLLGTEDLRASCREGTCLLAETPT
jgi:hypothetical protein